MTKKLHIWLEKYDCYICPMSLQGCNPDQAFFPIKKQYSLIAKYPAHHDLVQFQLQLYCCQQACFMKQLN